MLTRLLIGLLVNACDLLSCRVRPKNYAHGSCFVVFYRGLQRVHLDYWGPFYQHGLTWIPAWIDNYIHYKMLDEVICPFPNFKGTTIDWSLGRISDFIPHCTGHVITYLCLDKNQSMLIKGAPGNGNMPYSHEIGSKKKTHKNYVNCRRKKTHSFYSVFVRIPNSSYLPMDMKITLWHCKMHVGQVMKVCLSCYLVLLSFDSKTR